MKALGIPPPNPIPFTQTQSGYHYRQALLEAADEIERHWDMSKYKGVEPVILEVSETMILLAKKLRISAGEEVEE